MAEKLTENEVAEYKEAFVLFDKDNDGKLTKSELVTIVENCDPFINPELLPKYMEEMGFGSGGVNYDDFTKGIWGKMTLPETEEQIIEAFKAFDSEDTGFIGVPDWAQILRVIGDKELDTAQMEDFVKLIQATGAVEKFDYKEFSKLIKKTCF